MKWAEVLKEWKWGVPLVPGFLVWLVELESEPYAPHPFLSSLTLPQDSEGTSLCREASTATRLYRTSVASAPL